MHENLEKEKQVETDKIQQDVAQGILPESKQTSIISTDDELTKEGTLKEENIDNKQPAIVATEQRKESVSVANTVADETVIEVRDNETLPQPQKSHVKKDSNQIKKIGSSSEEVVLETTTKMDELKMEKTKSEQSIEKPTIPAVVQETVANEESLKTSDFKKEEDKAKESTEAISPKEAADESSVLQMEKEQKHNDKEKEKPKKAKKVIEKPHRTIKVKEAKDEQNLIDEKTEKIEQKTATVKHTSNTKIGPESSKPEIYESVDDQVKYAQAKEETAKEQIDLKTEVCSVESVVQEEAVGAKPKSNKDQPRETFAEPIVETTIPPLEIKEEKVMSTMGKRRSTTSLESLEDLKKVPDLEMDGNDIIVNVDVVDKVKEAVMTVVKNFKPGVSVSEVMHHLSEQNLEVIKKPESQVALLNVAKRIGKASIVEETVISELATTEQSTETFGCRALLLAMESPLVKVDGSNLLTYFHPKDFDISKAKATTCRMINQALEAKEGAKVTAQPAHDDLKKAVKSLIEDTNNGKNVTEIIAEKELSEIEAMQCIESQMAMICVVEKLGHSDTTEAVVLEQMSSSDRAGMLNVVGTKALSSVLKQNSYTTDEVVQLFTAEDFQPENVKKEVAKVLNMAQEMNQAKVERDGY